MSDIKKTFGLWRSFLKEDTLKEADNQTMKILQTFYSRGKNGTI
jgi:hypothetical protein